MKLVECPQCLGTKQYFDGENIIDCLRCDTNGQVSEEDEEEYYIEGLELDNPEFIQFNEEEHSPNDFND